MTTPRDAIGLSERLRRQGAGEDGYRTVFNGTLLEAATALDALQARVAELIGLLAAGEDLRRQVKDVAEHWQARATSAEQERDEAYELAAKVAEGLQCRNCNSVVPSGDGIGLCCGRPDYDSISDVPDAIRRLAAGTEKEGK
jgi:hypothetical protein